MKKMLIEEQLSVTGGAVWVCLTCGYISNDHWSVDSAKVRAYDHEKKYKGHKTKVRP